MATPKVTARTKKATANKKRSISLVQARQRKFLTAFVQTMSIIKSCQASGVHRRTHYDWLAKHPEYVTQFNLAKIQGCQMIQDTLLDRGINGYKEQYTTQELAEDGKMITTKTVVKECIDNNILIQILRANSPEYSNRDINITADNIPTVNIKLDFGGEK